MYDEKIETGELLEKHNSFENTEIKISRSFESHNYMPNIKNRKNNYDKKEDITSINDINVDIIKQDDQKEDSNINHLINEHNQKEPSQHIYNINDKNIMDYNIDENISKNNEKEKHIKIPPKNISITQKEYYNNNDIFNYSLDIFSSEMFNEKMFHSIISLFELYMAIKTLKLMNPHIFNKLYQMYNKKIITFDTSVMFYINKLRDDIKSEIEQIDKEINTGDTTEKERIQNYYYYKEELFKRKKLEEELLSKIKSLEECIEVNKRSQSLRNMLLTKKKKNNNLNNENLEEHINYIFSHLHNEGTYKLNHSQNMDKKN